MKSITLLILLLVSFETFTQVKVNPNGKFFNHNGLKVYYEDSGTGEPLLLLHNFYSTADQWKPHVEVYSKEFRTIAVDMLGHGRSDIYKRDETGFRHADYAKVILALLDFLKLPVVNAIGASSGGITLLYLNTMQPTRFKAVVTIGAQIYYSDHIRKWSANRGPDDVNAGFMQWATSQHGAEKATILAKKFFNMLSQYGDPSFTPDELSTIKANWLVVHGDKDEPVPLQQALDMHQYIPGSSLWVVPNGGHTPHTQDNTQADFIKTSLAFLKGEWNK